MAIEVIKPESHAAWLAARQKDITASTAAALLGVHPYTTAFQLWGEKTGRARSPESDERVLRRGQLLEPVVVEMIRQDRPDWQITYKQDNTYFRDADRRMGATPDVFAKRPDRAGLGIVQIKTVAESAFRKNWIDKDTKDVVCPLWVAIQALVEADLTHTKWATVGAMTVGFTLDLHLIDVPLHKRIIKRLEEAVDEFWRIADSGDHPPIEWEQDAPAVLATWADSDGTIVDLPDDPELLAAAIRYEQSAQTITDAKSTMAEDRARLIHALGNAEAGRLGNRIISAKTQYRPAHEVGASQTRALRIRTEERIHNGPF